MRELVTAWNDKTTPAGWLAVVLLLLSLAGLVPGHAVAWSPTPAFNPDAAAPTQLTLAERAAMDAARHGTLIKGNRPQQAAWGGTGPRGDIAMPVQTRCGWVCAAIAADGTGVDWAWTNTPTRPGQPRAPPGKASISA